MDTQGKIYLIPIPIAENNLESLAAHIKPAVEKLRYYFVENIRTARRFIKAIYPEAAIDEMQFSEINKHQDADISLLQKWLKAGNDVGIMSESGCPGIADPGAELIAAAQEMDMEILPLVGPNAIILALMASGMNGQNFAFNGYLPIKEPQRNKQIKHIEEISKKNNQTQIFIETPYRNKTLLEDLLKHCQPHTKICIAYHITSNQQFIKTKMVKNWKSNLPVWEKQPCVFLLQA